jgi:monooxygenase
MTSALDFDVLIVGAGLSGIGAAAHLKRQCAHHSFAVLEGRAASGGTWDLFRYPGVRSDSDMYTLGYRFRPWLDAKAIADGPSILRYIRDTARDEGLEEHIRYQHRVKHARWSTERARWELAVQVGEDTALTTLSCSFLWICSGYYNYDHGYRPDFAGSTRFKGRIVHPQHWNADIAYAGQRVVVIGSGATAVTLVPSLAATAAHVTLLQRSPSYVVTLPSQDRMANVLNRTLPHSLAYAITRWKNVLKGMLFFYLSKRRPQRMKLWIMNEAQKLLGPNIDVQKHFSPRYKPWDQRVCLVPDADLFVALQSGCASVVTDTVDCFTETGVRLRSGAELQADLIVTATGLDLLAFGGIELSVDGVAIRLNEKLTYKGMMLQDVPNMAYVVGYTNASWTLKADLISQYVCRVLHHLRNTSQPYCTPRLEDASVKPQDWVDFSSGYVQRALHMFPKQGNKSPWCLHQNYVLDVINLRYGRLDDGALKFSGQTTPSVP